jgi:hypothetical protein
VFAKSLATAITAGLVVAVFLPVSPAFRGEHGDEFPFSWYPMFAHPRPSLETVYYVLGSGTGGQRRIVHAHYYLKGGMNQARRQIARLVREPRTTQETCERAARRVASDQSLSDVKELRVVRGQFDMKKYFSERNKQPEREVTLARCPVLRTPKAKRG